METKQTIRRQVKDLLKSGGGTDSSRPLCCLEQHPLFLAAQTVLLYWSMPEEVDTHALIRKWSERKRIVLPRVCGEELELRLYDPERMVPGYRGILEPAEDALPVPDAEIDLAIVPGLAFDRAGHRLGRGKGYYDRLLPRLHCPKLGLAFPCQVLDEVPIEAHDVALDGIIY